MPARWKAWAYSETVVFVRVRFDRAADALLNVRSPMATFLSEQIVLAQKFLMPDAGKMVLGRAFNDFKESMQLPFDRVALYRDAPFGNGTTRDQICVAISAHIFDAMNGGRTSNAEFYLADAICADHSRNIWAPTRFTGVSIGADGGAQLYEHEDMQREEMKLYGHFDDHTKGWGALGAITELMLLLGLDNVSTERIEAPPALNKKRKKNGHLPIYDYHVLLIDGQKTHGPFAGQSDRTIRSHFRRGHIRRLSDSRRIWVRPAYVHGASDGFVDKDYLTKH